jgi:hypothetical protein
VPTVEIEFHRGRVQIDTDTLTPKARALAEAVAARELPVFSVVLLRSTRPLRDMPAGQVPAASTWYTAEQLDQPDTITWSSWSWLPRTSDIPPEVYLETQAARLPIDYVPVPDKDTPIPEYAAGCDELLTRDRVLEVLRHHGREIAVSTWDSYRSRGRSPRPDTYVGRTPLWRMSTILTFAKTVPRPGTRTDLMRSAR